MVKPPELRLNDIGQVEGWEELDNWAWLNHPGWRAISEMCRNGSVLETNRLKLLCYNLLEHNHVLFNKAVELIDNNGYPKSVIPK